MNNEENIKYIGQQKVVEYNEKDGKVQYTLENSSGDTVTKEQFESMLKSKPYDDGQVRVFKWLPAVGQIMKVLLDNEMKVSEKSFVLGRVDETIIANYDLASARLYGTDYEHNIGLREIHNVLIGKRIGNSVESLSSELTKKENTMSEEQVQATPETPVVETPAVEAAPAAPEQAPEAPQA